MEAISLDAAVAVTNISKSTLWRRVTDELIGKAGKDGRNRTMLQLIDVLPLIEAPSVVGDEEVNLLLRADAGAADAQADAGAMFYIAGNTKAALYWLHEAAAQDNTDAMHWLAIAHAACAPTAAEMQQGGSLSAREREDNLAVMWLAKAAALGHPLAQQQMAQMKSLKR